MNIKDFIFKPDPIAQAAMARYCHLCKQTFKTPNAKNAHTAIKHKKYGK